MNRIESATFKCFVSEMPDKELSQKILGDSSPESLKLIREMRSTYHESKHYKTKN